MYKICNANFGIDQKQLMSDLLALIVILLFAKNFHFWWKRSPRMSCIWDLYFTCSWPSTSHAAVPPCQTLKAVNKITLNISFSVAYNPHNYCSDSANLPKWNTGCYKTFLIWSFCFTTTISGPLANLQTNLFTLAFPGRSGWFQGVEGHQQVLLKQPPEIQPHYGSLPTILVPEKLRIQHSRMSAPQNYYIPQIHVEAYRQSRQGVTRVMGDSYHTPWPEICVFLQRKRNNHHHNGVVHSGGPRN